MTRRAALAALAVSAAAAWGPAGGATACDASQAQYCLTLCTTVDHWHDQLSRVFADPIPKPVC